MRLYHFLPAVHALSPSRRWAVCIIPTNVAPRAASDLLMGEERADLLFTDPPGSKGREAGLTE